MASNTLIQGSIRDHNAALDTIEALIDTWTVGGVLDLMAEVASAKADHIRSSYSDEYTAGQWDKFATKLLQAQRAILTQR
jgi:hypothetical protein